MIYLFGSRAHGCPRLDSDIDLLITEDSEAEALRPYLIAHGGPVDAFWDGPDWLVPVDEEESGRMLLVDDPTPPLPITLENAMALIPQVTHNHKED